MVVHTGALTWEVASAIHERCCQGASCSGPSEHLQAAAVAVELLAGGGSAGPGRGGRLAPAA